MEGSGSLFWWRRWHWLFQDTARKTEALHVQAYSTRPGVLAGSIGHTWLRRRPQPGGSSQRRSALQECHWVAVRDHCKLCIGSCGQGVEPASPRHGSRIRIHDERELDNRDRSLQTAASLCPKRYKAFQLSPFEFVSRGTCIPFRGCRLPPE
jgi:hypothetical protein